MLPRYLQAPIAMQVAVNLYCGMNIVITVSILIIQYSHIHHNDYTNFLGLPILLWVPIASMLYVHFRRLGFKDSQDAEDKDAAPLLQPDKKSSCMKSLSRDCILRLGKV